MESVLRLLAIMIWPTTVVFGLLLFRRQITALTRLIERVEAPGGFKVILDREKVEDIIKEGAKENTSPEELAKQIEKSAELEVMDTLELRVLRALFDEDHGRAITNYERYYQNAIRNLFAKHYIEKRDTKYALTNAGVDVAKKYLSDAIARKGGVRKQ